MKTGPKSKSNWLRNNLDAFFPFISLLKFQKYVCIILHSLNKSIPLFLLQRDIFYFKADLFWGVRKLAEFPKIKTLNSGWIKYQEVSLCPFSIEVHSSWGVGGGGGGATRMDFIYSFEVQFSHRTGGKKSLQTICTAMISSLHSCSKSFPWIWDIGIWSVGMGWWIEWWILPVAKVFFGGVSI